MNDGFAIRIQGIRGLSERGPYPNEGYFVKQNNRIAQGPEGLARINMRHTTS